jgi:hypothetical protein
VWAAMLRRTDAILTENLRAGVRPWSSTGEPMAE